MQQNRTDGPGALYLLQTLKIKIQLQLLSSNLAPAPYNSPWGGGGGLCNPNSLLQGVRGWADPATRPHQEGLQGVTGPSDTNGTPAEEVPG